MAIEISLCMIVKNEEQNLANCLDCVRDIADEINIVDTGSTDKTVEVASRYTDRIFQFDWVNDFAAARNFSFSKATKDYILWLDADDIITPENQTKILELKKTLPRDIRYVLMDYYYAFDDYGNPIYIQPRERLVKRTAEFTWHSPIHETLNVSGKYLSTKIYVSHMHMDAKKSSARNLEILEQNIIKDDNDNKMLLYYYTLLLYEAERYEEGLACAEKFMRLNRADANHLHAPDIYMKTYNAYRNQKDDKRALQVLEENGDILSDCSEYYCELGLFYQNERNDYEAALNSFLKALTCKGSTNGGRMEEFYYYVPNFNLANLCVKINLYAEAVHYFKEALVYNPQNTKIVNIINQLEKVALADGR